MESTNASCQPGTSKMGSSELDKCAQMCLECYQICAKTISYCLSKGSKHAELKHITLLEDCAKICATSADFLIRGSELHAYTCAACAEICERCAKECKQMSDNKKCECADTCARCAESCRSMSAH